MEKIPKKKNKKEINKHNSTLSPRKRNKMRARGKKRSQQT